MLTKTAKELCSKPWMIAALFLIRKIYAKSVIDTPKATLGKEVSLNSISFAVESIYYCYFKYFMPFSHVRFYGTSQQN